MTLRCRPVRRENQWTVSHRMTGTPTYKVWQGMLRRCYATSDKDFPNYGGRGITVCAEWERFENFFADMGERPPGMTLERRELNGPYCKENCIWATVLEQNRNRRCSINVTWNGETKPLQVWCDEFGINYYTAHNRLTRFGWPVERLFAPARKNRPRRRDSLTADELQAIRTLLSVGTPQRVIASKYRISQGLVSKIKLRPIRPDAEPVDVSVDVDEPVEVAG